MQAPAALVSPATASHTAPLARQAELAEFPKRWAEVPAGVLIAAHRFLELVPPTNAKLEQEVAPHLADVLSTMYSEVCEMKSDDATHNGRVSSQPTGEKKIWDENFSSFDEHMLRPWFRTGAAVEVICLALWALHLRD
jgi:hypothetical protein